MKGILKVLTSRWLLLGIAFLMLSLVIWWGGPYLSLGTIKPFESGGQRLLGILWLAVLFALGEIMRWLRARRASNQLAQGVSAQATPANQPSGDAAQLRQRFEEALAALRASKGKAFNLYELPWYIIIGPPGVGKTTVIANSGLNFPLAKKFGTQALRGVGGTRNCDWWFTEEAVMLDTAGRYTTQDSDANSDAAGWTEFLSLLKKHRSRRPINGVIVAMSAPDLLSQSEGERQRHVQAVRDRLDELGRELKIELPVYLFLTKLDLIAGFTEFFDDLNQDYRSQVWGVTFPLELSRSGQGPEQFPTEFDHLLERLNSRLMGRLQAERDVRRRSLLFTFPRQFAAVRRNLTDFVNATFGTEGGAARKLQLRGVYFTSGTQEGTPIDRMIGALARTFGLNMRNVPSQQSQGRAYFIQRLLREVLFKESGLAGINRRMELRQGVLNISAYVAVALVLIIGLIGFTVSYRQNRAYLETMKPPVTEVNALGDQEPPSQERLVASLKRLDTFEKVIRAADQFRNGVPFSMRWGLFQGNSMNNAAQDSYLRELNAKLLPAVADHLRDQVIALGGEPDKLYEYLKAYLMFGEPQRREMDPLQSIGNVEWPRVFSDEATLERFTRHYTALIADADHMQPAQVDTKTVEQARSSLAQASLPRLMYTRLKLSYPLDDKRSINLAERLGLGADTVLIREGGRSLSDPLPAFYTKKVFKEISGYGQAELVQQFISERWVLGDKFVDIQDTPLLTTRLLQLYEADYIKAWDDLIYRDIKLAPIGNTRQAAQQWGLLGASTSPLKQLYQIVKEETFLVDTNAPPPQPSRIQATLNSVLGANAPSKQPPPGTTITKHFEQLHKLVTGTPAPIDLTLQKFQAIQNALNQMNEPPTADDANRLRGVIRDLEANSATLPGVVQKVVQVAQEASQGQIEDSISTEFMNRYAKVVAECRDLTGGRYPLSASGSDMTLDDFSKVFGPNGTFDVFFKEAMLSNVDVSGKTWKWKQNAPKASAGIPRQFQQADAIRQIFFGNSPTPRVSFSVTMDYADDNVTRASFTVDGQKYEFRNGPTDVARQMTWPGPNNATGMAEITADLAVALPNPIKPEYGPWAFFKILGQADQQSRAGGTRFSYGYIINGRSVRILITPSSSRNPFVNNPFKGFSCQG